MIIQKPTVEKDGPGYWRLAVKTIDTSKPALQIQGNQYVFTSDIQVGRRISDAELISKLSD